jgi:hypothetical protein
MIYAKYEYKNETYMINVAIQGTDTCIFIDEEEPFSVVTTGFLKNLDLDWNNIELNKKLIVLYGKVLESEGIFKETFILGNSSLKHSVRIIHADLPFLLFGGDWFDDHYAKYGKSRKYMYFNDNQQRRIRIPLIDLPDEEELELNEDIEITKGCSEANIEITEECSEAIIEEQLICLSEESIVSTTMHSELVHVSADIFEIDGEMFQNDFSQEHVEPNRIEQEIIIQDDDLWEDNVIDEILMCYIEEEIDEEKSLMVDPFQQLPSEFLTESFNCLTITDSKDFAQVNRKIVNLMKNDEILQLSRKLYYSNARQEALYLLKQMYQYIHLDNKFIGKEVIRKFERALDIFYSTDYVKFFWNTQGNQMLNVFRPQLMNNVQKNIMNRQITELNHAKLKKCNIWNQRHVIKKFILELKFRAHNKYCRNNMPYTSDNWKNKKLALFKLLMNWKKKRKVIERNLPKISKILSI